MTLTQTVENQQAYNNATSEINTLTASINAINLSIQNKTNEINLVQSQLQNIVNDVSFQNNFTEEQLKQLRLLTFVDVYQNENYIQTDNMTLAEIQDLSQELYEQGQRALDKLSQPTYTMELTAGNYLFIDKFKAFSSETELGALIHAEVKPNTWIQPILLEVSIDYDNPSELGMTFGNRFRLSTAEWTFADLFNSNAKTSSFVNINSDLMTKPVKKRFSG